MAARGLIDHLQDWLLAHGRCPGCGRPLEKVRRQKKGGRILAVCHCRRLFVYQPMIKAYRRALLGEVIEANSIEYQSLFFRYSSGYQFQ